MSNSIGPAWVDVNSTRHKLTSATPLVTIFGAGVAGLTAAHELIERGFAVQVVEPARDQDEEYACLVGGLAANQLARGPATVREAHPYLFDEDPDDLDRVDPYPRMVRVFVHSSGFAEDLILRVNNWQSNPLPTAGLNTTQIADLLELNFAAPDAEVARTGNTLEFTSLDAAGQPDERHAPLVQVWVQGAAGNTESVQVRYETALPLGQMRNLELHEAIPRIPTPERIQMGGVVTVSTWPDKLDSHGVANSAKITALFDRLVLAYQAIEQDRLVRAVMIANEHHELSDRMRIREGLVVEIRGHASGFTGDEQAAYAQSLEFATWVRAALIAKNDDGAGNEIIPELMDRLILVPCGRLSHTANPKLESGREANARVEFRIVESIIPGEHGYRFFPRFYRHLFDTMKRTPLLDEHGRATGETAFDQLVAAPTVDLASTGGDQPAEVPAQRPQSLEEFRELLKLHLQPRKRDLDDASDEAGLGLEPTDLLRFQLAIIKYLTSCKARREAFEGETWLDFLLGDWRPGSGDPAPYSKNMLKLLRNAPQALVAMNAEETDARTQGTIYCQLLLDSLTGGEDSNRTLNGPTSDAWLRHWKAYLKRQGVRFFSGALDSLDWVENSRTNEWELVPSVTLKASLVAAPRVRVLADGNAFTMTLNDDRFSVPGSSDLLDAIHQLATAINDAAPGTNADTEFLRAPGGDDGGWIVLTSVGNRYRVRSTNMSPPEVPLVINGVPIGTSGERGNLRDKIVAGVRAAFGEQVRASFRGEEEVFLDPRSESRFVSVRKPGLLQIAVRDVPSGGETIDVVAQVEVPYRASPGQARDALLERLAQQLREAGVDVGAGPLGETGIEVVAGPLRPKLELHGCVAGLDVQIAPEWSDLFFNAPPVPPIILNPGENLSVMGNVPDESLDDLVTAEIDITGTLTDAAGGGPDFYLMAVPYEEASRLVWDAYQTRPTDMEMDEILDGCFGQFQNFELATSRWQRTSLVGDPPAYDPIPLVRDDGGRPTPPEYPLRDLSGIQYYFGNQVRLGRGHSYFPDAAWGLSSISQLAYWRERLPQGSAFLGQLSVDIGDWYSAYGEDGQRVPSAWRSTKAEIAERTWEQILDGLEERKRVKMLRPTYFHLDQGIRFENDGSFASGSGIVMTPADPALATTTVDVSGVTLSSTVTGSKAAIVADLVSQVAAAPATYPFQAAPWPDADHLLLTPVARSVAAPNQPAEVRLRVLGARNGADYSIRINGQDVSVTAALQPPPPSRRTQVRDALVAAINANVVGVLATAVANRAISVQSNSDLSVSALADRGDPVLVVNPPRLIELETLDNLEVVSGQTPTHNATPFLINGPRVWEHRPGTEMIPPAADPHFEALQGETRHIFYRATRRRWYMVGNQMATHTRMSTMESSNESARHAVVAMLHELMQDPPAMPTAPYYNGQGHLLGEMPQIFDPELHEIDDTLPLKRLDEALFGNAGGPHFLDILKAEEMIDQMPDLKAAQIVGPELQNLVQSLGGQVLSDWSFTELDELQQAAQAVIASLVGIQSN